jgi:hypothetical protein
VAAAMVQIGMIPRLAALRWGAPKGIGTAEPMLLIRNGRCSGSLFPV